MNLEKFNKDMAIFKALNDIKTDIELAKKIGVIPNTLYKWKAGKKIGDLAWMKIEKATKGEIRKENYL